MPGYLGELPLLAVSAWLLGWVAYTDLRTRTIPNRLIMLGLAGVALLHLFGGQPISPVSMLLGATLGAGALLLPYVAFRGHFGAGDVKLGGLVGVVLGYPWTAFALGAVGILLVAGSPLMRRSLDGERPRRLPFGALLAVVALLCLSGRAAVAWQA